MSSAPDKRFMEVVEPTPSFPAGSAARELQVRGRLRIGVVPGTLGFVEQNPETGRLEGIDVDLADLVAQGIFGGTRATARKSVDFVAMQKHEREAALESDEVDLVISTYAISDLRRRRVDFTQPYFGASLGVLTSATRALRSLSELETSRIGVVEGSIGDEYLRSHGLQTNARLVEHDRDMVAALRRDEVDVILGSSCVLANFCGLEPGVFERPSCTLQSISYGIGLKKGSSGLRDLLDERLHELCENATLVEVAQRGENRRSRATRNLKATPLAG